jgi:hypothetical protein
MFVREKELEYVSSFKYLGVHLDELFSFRDHFHHVSGKVSSHSGVIRKLRRYLSQQAFTTLVNAYIFSVIDYCLIVWGPSRVKDLDSLQSKFNQLLFIFFYPEAATFYGKSYWNKSDSENRRRVAESRAFFNKLDYNSLLENCNFLSVEFIPKLTMRDRGKSSFKVYKKSVHLLLSPDSNLYRSVKVEDLFITAPFASETSLFLR